MASSVKLKCYNKPVLTGKQMNEKFLNIIPDVTVVGSVLLACLLNWLYPIVQIISYPLNGVGWAVIAIGVILALNTISVIRSRNKTSYVVQVPPALIAEGAYSVSRNPFYLSYVVVVLGVAIVLGSVTAFIAPIVCFAVLRLFVIPVEEKKLQNAFGQKYLQYKRSVRRWI